MLMFRFAAVFFHTLKVTLGLTQTVLEAGTNTPLGFNCEFQIYVAWIPQSLQIFETVYTTE